MLAQAQQSAAAAAAAAAHMVKQHASLTQHLLHNVLMQLHVKYPRLVPDSWSFNNLGGGGGDAPQEGAWFAEVLAGDSLEQLKAEAPANACTTDSCYNMPALCYTVFAMQFSLQTEALPSKW